MFNQLSPRPLGLDSCLWALTHPPCTGCPSSFLVWWTLSPSISKPAPLWSRWCPPTELISNLGAPCSFAHAAGTVHFSYQCLSVYLLFWWRIHPLRDWSCCLLQLCPSSEGPPQAPAQSRCSANTCWLTCWRRPRKTSKWAKEEWVRRSAS